MSDSAILLDSITDATNAICGRVVVAGSHGGLYPAAIASGFAPRAAIFHDAGIGLERAGVAGVMALAGTGMAAAAVGFDSCAIGSGAAMWASGRISRCNAIAAGLGVISGMDIRDAVDRLQQAPCPATRLPPVPEARRVIETGGGREIILVDSASLVGPQDVGKLIVTGSHGGLIGGDPERALKARARLAAFNDAGFGPDDVARSRLPALERQGVGAVLVSCRSARIGDAGSGHETGVISFVNRTAAEQGAVVGHRLKYWLENMAD
jgi:hypothetical protein